MSNVAGLARAPLFAEEFCQIPLQMLKWDLWHVPLLKPNEDAANYANPHQIY